MIERHNAGLRNIFRKRIFQPSMVYRVRLGFSAVDVPSTLRIGSKPMNGNDTVMRQWSTKGSPWDTSTKISTSSYPAYTLVRRQDFQRPQPSICMFARLPIALELVYKSQLRDQRSGRLCIRSCCHTHLLRPQCMQEYLLNHSIIYTRVAVAWPEDIERFRGVCSLLLEESIEWRQHEANTGQYCNKKKQEDLLPQ